MDARFKVTRASVVGSLASLVFVTLLVLPLALCAQSTDASLGGRITDSAKAVIVDARITAISNLTNVRYERASNGSGEYSFPSLAPGVYSLEIQKPGFRRLIKPGVVLYVQDSLRLDFTLTVGSATESIAVESSIPAANRASPAVSTVIDRTFVENLPLNGRTFQNLILLTPGVVPTAASLPDQGQFSINGQRADANYFSVDGVSANFGVTSFLPMGQSAAGALPALSATGGTNSLVSVDSMQEFRIQTSSFAAEFGRSPGGQISVVTRSGTNSFHGTLFEYFRNGALDANDWFANANQLPKPDEKQNDFGGVFGGPIIKDRSFFFFSYEGLRLRQPFTQQSVVPNAASRQSAPPAMRPFLNAFPIANGPAAGAGLAQFNASYSNPASLDAYSIRVDQVVDPKINFFARYNYSPSNLDQRAAPFPAPALSTVDSIISSIHTATLGLTELLGAAISNEVRLNYSNQRLATRFHVDDFGGAVPIPDFILFPSGFTSSNSAFLLLINGVGQYGQGKAGTDEQRQINAIDNLSVTSGRHDLRFGVDYRWLAPFGSPFAYRSFVQFTGVTANPGGALSGRAANAQLTAFTGAALLSQNLSFYGQDTWKSTSRLTLTYGLRWDINPALTGKNSANDPFTVVGLNNPATMTLAPRGTPLYGTKHGNVAPRIGLAWELMQQPNWGTVLRAAFGTFYDLGQGAIGATSAFFPYSATKTLALAPFPLSPQNAAPPALTTNPPVGTIIIADPHLKLPRTYQWNVALEQSIRNTQSISLTYIGAMGRDLLRVTNLSNPNPNFQLVELTDNSATSDYHALQIAFQRRLSHGLQAQASYTWAHSIDISSSDALPNQQSTPAALARPALDRGNSDFDVRHAFTSGVSYVLPSLQRQPFAHALLGGWSLHSFLLARSSPPVNLVGATFSVAGVSLSPRPNVIAGVPLELFGPQYPGGKIFNKAAFTAAPAGQQGNFGRNVLRGFGATQFDLALQRQFHLTEQLSLRFRSEVFNIFNHPDFGSPNNLLTSPLFGRSTQTLANSLGSGGANGGLNPLYQIGGPRSIQLGMKLQF
jgi:hypothetical protein